MDKIDKQNRSRIMSRIRSKGNLSTEKRLRFAMVRSGIKGWHLHAQNVQGKPDFYFPSIRLAIFVDGCFWHGCLSCYRRPKTRKIYWDEKLVRNLSRDRLVNKELKSNGISLLRVWEHELVNDPAGVLKKVLSSLNQISEKSVNKLKLKHGTP